MQSFNKKKFKPIKLCRYGGINKLIKQKGNYNHKSEFDSKYEAPEKYGFYAFIFPFIDYSLLYGRANGGKTRANEVKNSLYMYKKFNAIDGQIWSHLKPLEESKIIENRGFWFKMDVKDLHEAIAYELQDTTKYYFEYVKTYDISKDIGFTVKNNLQHVDKTDFEVFICRDTIIS